MAGGLGEDGSALVIPDFFYQSDYFTHTKTLLFPTHRSFLLFFLFFDFFVLALYKKTTEYLTLHPSLPGANVRFLILRPLSFMPTRPLTHSPHPTPQLL